MQDCYAFACAQEVPTVKEEFLRLRAKGDISMLQMQSYGPCRREHVYKGYQHTRVHLFLLNLSAASKLVAASKSAADENKVISDYIQACAGCGVSVFL
jgi:hypothetical protein